MKTFHRERTGDTITVPDALANQYDAHPDWAEGSGPDSAAPDELKGEALDQALEAAGLPKSGTVAEKRARLAQKEQA